MAIERTAEEKMRAVLGNVEQLMIFATKSRKIAEDKGSTAVYQYFDGRLTALESVKNNIISEFGLS